MAGKTNRQRRRKTISPRQMALMDPEKARQILGDMGAEAPGVPENGQAIRREPAAQITPTPVANSQPAARLAPGQKSIPIAINFPGNRPKILLAQFYSMAKQKGLITDDAAAINNETWLLMFADDELRTQLEEIMLEAISFDSYPVILTEFITQINTPPA